jgi:hypothetical protein
MAEVLLPIASLEFTPSCPSINTIISGINSQPLFSSAAG